MPNEIVALFIAVGAVAVVLSVLIQVLCMANHVDPFSLLARLANRPRGEQLFLILVVCVAIGTAYGFLLSTP